MTDQIARDDSEAARLARVEAKVRQVELAISWVLRVGVVIATLVVAAGLGLMFARHGQYTTITGSFSYHTLTSPGTSFPHTLSQMARSLGHLDGRGLVVLGLMILILTPVLRVAVSVLAFIYERDPAMTLVTLFVLGALLLSFFLAGAI
jgi:uncharacterized membrane protein